jgi:circadian clock protein KaiB
MTSPGGTDPAGTLSPNDAATPDYVLRLFITGQTGKSTLALENIRRICERHIPGRYKLEVIDIYQDPSVASEAQIIAAPTLIKVHPAPLRRIIGDLSDEAKVLFALNVTPRGTAGGP